MGIAQIEYAQSHHIEWMLYSIKSEGQICCVRDLECTPGIRVLLKLLHIFKCIEMTIKMIEIKIKVRGLWQKEKESE